MHAQFKELLRGARRVGFFGLGASNLSLLSILPEGTSVTLRADGEIKIPSLPSGVTLSAIYEGARAAENITEEILFLSPSVRRDRPMLLFAEANGTRLLSDSELFFESANAPVLAVSGSSGKSTTAYLAAALINGSEESYPSPKAKSCSQAKRGAVLCGNIGRPMFSSISEGAKAYVTELSSFMLMNHKATVARGAITNISENHLDWHGSMEEYVEAKLSLLRLSNEIIINADDERLSGFVGRSRRVFGVFSTRLTLPELLRRHKAHIYMTLEGGSICRNGEQIINTGRLVRREEYNIANMMCASLLASGYGDAERVESVLSSFSGLPHRCEVVLKRDGITYINSSIDTTPTRTAKTLSAIGDNVILLLGGRDKGLPLTPIISAARGKVKQVFTFGESGEKIAKTLSPELAACYSGNFRSAILAACEMAKPNDTVILSPSGTSYDEFSSFEERGESFCKLLSELYGSP